MKAPVSAWRLVPCSQAYYHVHTLGLFLLAGAVDLTPVVIGVGIRACVEWSIVLSRERSDDRTLYNGLMRETFFELAGCFVKV